MPDGLRRAPAVACPRGLLRGELLARPLDDVGREVEQFHVAVMSPPPREMPRAIIRSRDGRAALLLKRVDRIGERAHARVTIMLTLVDVALDLARPLLRVAFVSNVWDTGGWPSRRT